MKESEIRDREVHKKYLELVREDSQKIFSDKSKFKNYPCPACGDSKKFSIFEKDNFDYVKCLSCDTIFNDPRPAYTDIEKLYQDSASTNFWINNFFLPNVEARREKIFKPRARFLASKFPNNNTDIVGDIGAGFGIFLEELGFIWSKSKLIAIEPSDEMAKICRSKNIDVIESMIEAVNPNDVQFNILTSFELVEHLYNPFSFFKKVNSLLEHGGYFYFTTLNGLGFDIQVLWEKSRSISPPHHLNFFNPFSIKILLERTGFELVEVSTPGKLDWEIVENSAMYEGADISRFFDLVKKYGTAEAKNKFQLWIAESNFSSHLSVLGRKI